MSNKPTMMEAWAERQEHKGGAKRRLPVAGHDKPLPRGKAPPDKSITTEDVLRHPDVDENKKAWLRQWRKAPLTTTNPPGFVTNEGCWEKAKSAAEKAGADDYYAFATYWYGENC